MYCTKYAEGPVELRSTGEPPHAEALMSSLPDAVACCWRRMHSVLDGSEAGDLLSADIMLLRVVPHAELALDWIRRNLVVLYKRVHRSETEPKFLLWHLWLREPMSRSYHRCKAYNRWTWRQKSRFRSFLHLHQQMPCKRFSCHYHTVVPKF